VAEGNIDRETTCCELTSNATGTTCTAIAHKSDTVAGGAQMISVDEGTVAVATRCFIHGGLFWRVGISACVVFYDVSTPLPVP
jgi:hypothetical protein